jgi:hypothetical protein
MSTSPAAGFGDPTAAALGFGDPFEVLGLDAGFGDPYDTLSAELSASTRTAPHTGGAPVEIRGQLPAGPCRVQLTIEGTPRELYSGRAGQGSILYPRRGGVLRGYTPPAPAGSYQLTLLYGPSLSQSLILSEALEVVPAARLAERYQLARYFPALYASGPRTYEQQPIDPATKTPTRGALELIIETAAALATGTARPSSVTTADTPAGEGLTLELESVLGFPERGRVWIAGHAEPVAYELASAPRSLTLLGRSPYLARLSPVELARDY